jgi:hypothetical protein
VTGENMKNAQFSGRNMPFDASTPSELKLKDVALRGEKLPESMVVRNPAPDASPPVAQSEHREFCLSY